MAKNKELKIIILGDAKSAERALQSTADHASKLGNAMKHGAVVAGAAFAAAGAALAAFAAKAINSTTDYAEAVDKIVKKTGESAEQIQRLAYAAEQEHASMETLSKGLDILSRNMHGASQGMGAAKDSFAALGIAVQNTDGSLRSSTDVLLDIADKFRVMDDEAQKSALAMEIFGRSGAELVPFLSMGREEIARLGKEADQLGIVLSGDNIKAIKNYADEVTKMQGAFRGLQMEAAVGVLPAISEVTRVFTDMLISMRESGVLSQIFSQLGEILITLKPSVEALFNALAGIMEAFGPVVSEALGRIGELFGRLAAVVVDSGILDVLARIGDIVITSILDVIETLMPAVEALAPVVTAILEFVAKALAEMGPVLSKIAAKLTDIITQILEKIEPYLDDIFDAISRIIDAILPILPQLLDLAMPFVDLLLELLPPIMQLVEWVSQLGAVLMEILGKALEWVIGVIQHFGAIWSSVWEGVKAVFAGIWDGIRWIYDHTIAPVVDALKGVWGGLQGAWDAAWSALKGVVKGAVLGILNVLRPMAYALDVLNVFSGEAVFEGPVLRAIDAVKAWHKGGWIPGMDELFLPLGLFQGGEYVLPRDAAAALGPANLEMLRQGRIPSGGNVYHVHFHIPGFFGSQRELDSLARKLVTEHLPRVTFATGGVG